LRVTLQSLRDWLDVNEASHLGAQLPLLVRGICYEGWHPAGTPVSERGKEAFVARIEAGFQSDPIDDPDEAISCSVKLPSRRISQGEIEDVRMRLPKQPRELWPNNAG